jgi:hypothetical protein
MAHAVERVNSGIKNTRGLFTNCTARVDIRAAQAFLTWAQFEVFAHGHLSPGSFVFIAF